MNQAEYARLAEQEESYWWHQGRLKIIASYLRCASGGTTNSKILNVGCGTGGSIALLESFGETDNVDTADAAIAFARRRGYKRVIKVDGLKLPFAAKSYDLIGAFDVLEHIDQEIAALKEWKRVLKDDGAIILTVPAYQWLWSGHDESLHHKRRYTAGRLKQAAQKARQKHKRKASW